MPDPARCQGILPAVRICKSAGEQSPTLRTFDGLKLCDWLSKPAEDSEAAPDRHPGPAPRTGNSLATELSLGGSCRALTKAGARHLATESAALRLALVAMCVYPCRCKCKCSSRSLRSATRLPTRLFAFRPISRLQLPRLRKRLARGRDDNCTELHCVELGRQHSSEVLVVIDGFDED